MRPELAREVDRWLEKAKTDLDASRVLMTGTKRFPTVAAFLSQQAAEKSMKAFLTSVRTDPRPAQAVRPVREAGRRFRKVQARMRGPHALRRLGAVSRRRSRRAGRRGAGGDRVRRRPARIRHQHYAFVNLAVISSLAGTSHVLPATLPSPSMSA